MQDSHTLPIGTELSNGRYRIDALLGQGGFGITYKSTQTSLGRIVAIKEFYLDGRCTRAEDGSLRVQSIGGADFETYKERFFDEAKLLAQFGNLPGIVNVIDFFRENNTVYYAMDLVPGDPLDKHLLRQPGERMPPAEATELVRKVALALAPVHEQGILHRDLKPANIIRQPNGEPVVLDFGAARAFISDRTAVHSVILTPGYGPPEQYVSTGKYSPTTDVYALGAVLYRLLIGHTPPASTNRLLEEELVPPHEQFPGIPLWLSQCVLKAMALKPANRYQTMNELAEALKATPVPTAAQAQIDDPTIANTVLVKQPEPAKAESAGLNQPVAPPDDGGSYLEVFNTVSFKMVAVQGGSFMMGGTNEQGADRNEWELPCRKVLLSGYKIGETPVTQALWRAVMGKNPSFFSGRDDCPVEQVSWQEAQAFIQRLNFLTKKKYRLPTEAEWEYAARGGVHNRGYKFSGGNRLGDLAWYAENAGGSTHGVGQKQPNELGLYDMSGNVWEWCSDWYAPYTAESQTNPIGPRSGTHRVYRGGSWRGDAVRCRISNRGGTAPGLKSSNIGFRLASD